MTLKTHLRWPQRDYALSLARSFRPMATMRLFCSTIRHVADRSEGNDTVKQLAAATDWHIGSTHAKKCWFVGASLNLVQLSGDVRQI
jgi:hypothetical protein